MGARIHDKVSGAGMLPPDIAEFPKRPVPAEERHRGGLRLRVTCLAVAVGMTWAVVAVVAVLVHLFSY